MVLDHRPCYVMTCVSLSQSSPAIGRSGTNATPEAELESLKYENSRLKVALASRWAAIEAQVFAHTAHILEWMCRLELCLLTVHLL